MKKKPNVKIGIIINIALTVLSIVYMFVYYIEQIGFEFNYNSLLFFIYFFIIYIFPFILGVNLFFFLFYSFLGENRISYYVINGSFVLFIR